MTPFIPFSRNQAFLPPPDAKDWLPVDGVAHLVVAAAERVPLGAPERIPALPIGAYSGLAFRHGRNPL